MIELKEVSKKYPHGITALDTLNLEIQPDEFVYLIGPSGAGKSTFIKLLYREEKASRGEVIVAGYNLRKIKRRQIPLLRRKISVVFQDYKLLPKKNVYENVAFALEVIKTKKREIKPRVLEALKKVGLENKLKAFPDELSGGEQQRLSIARAIVDRPSILIADEPTGNLDAQTAEEIMQILEKIHAEGTLVIMATHNHALIKAHPHRVITIEHGKITDDRKEDEYAAPLERKFD
ncbi:cell division ATP-binding protein FtsE [Enterococcus hirae]|nr:cell division ATP-binding protein FtsE [Enterococcaceae bacterium]MCI1918726.1 cell division ATP-binding protein FtsE [Enterococcaceae bacterium]MDM8214181.1 cell division ATP-binding protein FtsE [Enterococcus hirae]